MVAETNLKTTLAISLFSIVLVVSGTVHAKIIYVDDDGPADFNTIQAAIDDSNDGDTVIVADGTYTGYGNRDIDFLGKEITVRSANGPENCIIDCQRAGRGFHFHSGEDESSIVRGFTITNAGAGGGVGNEGGGIVLYNSSPIIINCTVTRNACDGVNCRDASSPYVINCTISENLGSGVTCSWRGSDPTLTNCTITGNGAEGLWCWKSRPKLTNCIVWDNAGGPFTILAAYPEVTYSCIESDGIWSGVGNINDDPLFCGWGGKAAVYVDSSNPGPGDGSQGNPFSLLVSALDYNLALSSQSPCLGTGKGAANMGADTGLCDNAGQPDRLVHLAPGVYSVRGLSLAHNVSVCGAGEEETVVEGTMFGLRTGAVVSYLAVTEGTSGGIRVGSGETPKILHCIIRDNDGGVSCAKGASPTLTNCTIKGNSGCGVSCAQGASPTLTNCIINDNDGGGVRCEYWCSPILTNCTIAGNSARYGGGVWFSKHNYPTLTNCTIVGNYADYGGGVGLNESCYPTLINCTIAWNSAGEGGGLRLDWDCVPVLTNSILWGNSDSSGTGESAQIQRVTMGTPVINYCCLQGWTGDLGGSGNIAADPWFVEPGYWADANDPNIVVEPNYPNAIWVEGDYHLLTTSPCIDAGDPNYMAEPNETDLDGNPRMLDGNNDGIPVVDMGAYEYSPPIPAETRITPRTINLTSKGKWITALLWLPEDYNVADIDPNTVFLEDEIKAESLLVDEQEQIAMARFSREQVQAILSIGEVELTITGQFTDGTTFEAADIIRVLNKAAGKPAK